MQSVVNKVGCSLAALLLSVACCLGPYAQAAYANAIAVQYVGAALASIIAVLGVSPKVDGNVDFTAIGEAYTSFVDGMAEAGADILKDTVSAWDKTLTQDIDWDNIGTAISSSTAELARMGEAGVIDLNALSMSGAFGLLPALLSLFIADQVSLSAIPKMQQFVSDLGFTTPPISFADSFSCNNHNFSQYYSWAAYALKRDDRQLISCSYSDTNGGWNWYLFDHDGVYYAAPWSTNTSGIMYIDDRGWSYATGLSISDSWIYLLSGLTVKSTANIVLHDYQHKLGSKDRYLLYDGATQSWNTDIGTLTDNPDVNLGHDYWDDAKVNKDILNPSAGASVIGADAVIDGDYIANRGSLGVITDWADINSWADALARAHAGVAEGALDGTISTTQTGTAVDVGTGELVTDTVGDLVKPGGNTSISPAMPGLFDGVIDAVSDKFPFCIPGDLHKCLLALEAAPVAPSFDWTFPLHHVGLTDVTIHIDLAPFDQVAMILRVCLSVTMTIGLIFLSIRLLNMWGGH